MKVFDTIKQNLKAKMVIRDAIKAIKANNFDDRYKRMVKGTIRMMTKDPEKKRWFLMMIEYGALEQRLKSDPVALLKVIMNRNDRIAKDFNDRIRRILSMSDEELAEIDVAKLLNYDLSGISDEEAEKEIDKITSESKIEDEMENEGNGTEAGQNGPD
jgi:hypothetical protein